MRLLGYSKNGRVNSKTQLFLKINANRAADLVPSGSDEIESKDSLAPTSANVSQKKKKSINPVLVASLNNTKRSTVKKLHTSQPSWDDALLIPLTQHDFTQILVLSIWDKHRRYKNYLGELRLCISDVLSNCGELKPKSDLKWYKLYSSRSHQGFVTGSLLLSFELIAKTKRKRRVRKSKAHTITTDVPIDLVVESDAAGFGAGSGADADSKPPIDLFSKFDSIKLTEVEELVQLESSEVEILELFKLWIDSLIVPITDSKLYKPDDQGFYPDHNAMSMPDVSDLESMTPSTNETNDIHSVVPPLMLTTTATTTTGVSLFDGTSDVSSDGSILSGDLLDISFGGGEEEIENEVSQAVSHLKPPPTTSGRFGRKKKPIPSHFEVGNHKNILGVIFLEIISCSDLPPMKNVTRTSFDMDPFVVVTFGKRTFRTSWKRHTLNPIFNERLAFEILSHEKNYDIQFSILDRDHFSFHDKVANKTLLMKEITDVSTEKENKQLELEDIEFKLGVPALEPLDYPSTTLQNFKLDDDPNMVALIKKKRFTKRKKITVKYADTSKFKTMDLLLNLHDSKYVGKYSPTLKIRARFEPYESLRRQFWKVLLEQYQFHEDEPNDNKYDYIELIALLDTLGCENSDNIVQEFFEEHDNKLTWGGDTLTIDEICDLLENYVTRTHTSKIFEIEKCPICFEKRFSSKHSQDIDIVTHFAICASKDWSIVNKLLLLLYATPQVATRRWFHKALIKLSYGKYKLGSNSANILVQDRLTGIIMEEKMGIYVRLGIRLLYKGLDLAKKRRIRQLLKALSVKQGRKFDLPALKNDIRSFIKFHSLDLSECLEVDPLKYSTFNDFFYRKLKPGSRPIYSPQDDRVVVSPADCRCTAYNSVDEATEFWVKGRNFTLAKLFNGNFDNLQDTSLFKPSECSLGIFRLAPQDYHRFHSPVTGTVKSIKHIDGEYYTVNPMAIRSELDVFGENVRTLISIETEDFGNVIMVAVGAMMVGSIVLTINEGDTLARGDEVGYFKFGGSTILLLFESKFFRFDSDITGNSVSSIETLIRVGQSVGHHSDIQECSISHIDFEKQSKDFKLNLIRVLTGGDLDTAKELSNWEAMRVDYSEADVVITDEEEGEGDDDDSFDSAEGATTT